MLLLEAVGVLQVLKFGISVSESKYDYELQHLRP